MANTLYNKFKQSLVRGEFDWADSDILALLIDTAEYTFSQTHDFLDDISAPAIIATSQLLTMKTDTDGVLGSANITFTGVPASEDVGAIILYKSTGVPGTSSLIAFLDTLTGVHLMTTGADVTLTLTTGNIVAI